MILGEIIYNAGRERLNSSNSPKLLPEWRELPFVYRQQFQEEVIRVSTISLQLLLPDEFWYKWTRE